MNEKQYSAKETTDYLISLKQLCDVVEVGVPNCLPETIIFNSIAVQDTTRITDNYLYVSYNESDDMLKKIVADGALAVLCDREIPGIPCIVVEDLQRATFLLTEWLYKSTDLPAVVVAGSEGKTTTKRMINEVLRTEKNVFCRIINENTLQALCYASQFVTNDKEVVVQEVDEKRALNTVYCSKVLRPSIAVVTNIAEAHIGYYGGKDKLVESFKGITAGMDENGIVLLNAEDPDSMNAGFDKRVITVSIKDASADYYASDIKYGSKGTSYVIYYGDKKEKICLKTIGSYNVYNSMMAFAVGIENGIKVKDIKKGLLRYRNSGIRQNAVKFGGQLVYMDCFNASAKSLKSACESFSLLNTDIRGKKAIVLGDIGEIEGFEEKTYSDIALSVGEIKPDAVVLFGEKSKMVADYINNTNISIFSCDTFDELNLIVKDLKNSGYKSFMFKASRMMALEKTIKKVFPIHYKIGRIQEKKQNSGQLRI